jgi:hypothetical protein
MFYNIKFICFSPGMRPGGSKIQKLKELREEGRSCPPALRSTIMG